MCIVLKSSYSKSFILSEIESIAFLTTVFISCGVLTSFDENSITLPYRKIMLLKGRGIIMLSQDERVIFLLQLYDIGTTGTLFFCATTIRLLLTLYLGPRGPSRATQMFSSLWIALNISRKAVVAFLFVEPKITCTPNNVKILLKNLPSGWLEISPLFIFSFVVRKGIKVVLLCQKTIRLLLLLRCFLKFLGYIYCFLLDRYTKFRYRKRRNPNVFCDNGLRKRFLYIRFIFIC